MGTREGSKKRRILSRVLYTTLQGIFDGFVKSPLCPLIVIPAKAGMTRFLIFYDSIIFDNSEIRSTEIKY